MSRSHVYGLFKEKAISDKEKKFNYILYLYGQNLHPSDFASYFIKEYPEDWESIKRKYGIHVSCSNGNNFPMPKPYAYLKMLYSEHLNTFERIKSKIDAGYELSNTERKKILRLNENLNGIFQEKWTEEERMIFNG